jgi:hypothetical protein
MLELADLPSNSWDHLRRRFAGIVYLAEGPSKSKSGIMTIRHNCCEDGIYVELGTYDIADWPSWTEIGPFLTDGEARVAASAKLEEAKRAVIAEGRDCISCDTHMDYQDDCWVCDKCGNTAG